MYFTQGRADVRLKIAPMPSGSRAVAAGGGGLSISGAGVGLGTYVADQAGVKLSPEVLALLAVVAVGLFVGGLVILFYGLRGPKPKVRRRRSAAEIKAQGFDEASQELRRRRLSGRRYLYGRKPNTEGMSVKERLQAIHRQDEIDRAFEESGILPDPPLRIRVEYTPREAAYATPEKPAEVFAHVRLDSEHSDELKISAINFSVPKEIGLEPCTPEGEQASFGRVIAPMDSTDRYWQDEGISVPPNFTREFNFKLTVPTPREYLLKVSISVPAFKTKMQYVGLRVLDGDQP